MRLLICLLIITGCSQVGTFVPGQPEKPIAVLPVEPKPVPVKGWPEAWSGYVADAVKAYSTHLPAHVTCPDGKTKVPFLVFIQGMARAESGFNPKAFYDEPAPTPDSWGLLQLSPSDYKNYRVTPVGDLKDPRENLTLGVRIMNALAKKSDGTVCGFYRQVGRYWSTVREPICWPQDPRKGWARTKLCVP